jgi:hypothetical protein
MVDLPPGWTITESIEEVPNPNFGTVFGYPFFTRKTFICTDENGQFVCASGSDQDCESQALSMAQSRTQQLPYNQPS